MKKFLLNCLVIVAILSSQAARAIACAVCLSGSGDGADGYNASLLFLMSTPYLVVGAIAGGLVVTYRRAQRRREQAEDGMTSGWNQEESGR